MIHNSTIFSFFSGSGFLDLGFETSGYKIAYVNEIFPPFISAYRHSRKFSISPNLNMDIMKVKPQT